MGRVLGSPGHRESRQDPVSSHILDMLKLQGSASRHRRVPRVFLVALLFGVLAAPAGALADTTASSNWAGYAVHRSGLSFRKVVAKWRQPGASCSPGMPSYSAFWIGLGGFSPSSSALEQTGTEVDCSLSGNVVSTAWYELVPSPSKTIALNVRPRDAISASVTINGREVTISLYDNTRHRGFRKQLRATAIDASSAEWIVEAPSECSAINTCQTLPLADFRSATFDFARAQTSGGHLSSISDRAWQTTKIKLVPGGRHFIVLGSRGAAGEANPSALRSRGSSFKVTYSQISFTANPLVRAHASAVSAGYLVHPGR
jgi:Peptidase A4 family